MANKNRTKKKKRRAKHNIAHKQRSEIRKLHEQPELQALQTKSNAKTRGNKKPKASKRNMKKRLAKQIAEQAAQIKIIQNAPEIVLLVDSGNTLPPNHLCDRTMARHGLIAPSPEELLMEEQGLNALIDSEDALYYDEAAA